MREGKGSRTAQVVAFNRALGNLAPAVPGFSDPIAERLLPGNWTRRFERRKERLEQSPSKSIYPFWFRGMGVFNEYRTLVLDKAIKTAPSFEQMVILGAGFDSRAWRLNELKQAVVFEIDYPDTQKLKLPQTKDILPLAKEVRFVPVDFSRDDLSTCLSNADHDPAKTTLWLWEGVTMYLPEQEIAWTLTAIANRSARRSRVAMTYMQKENGKVPGSLFLSLIGEPVRSAFAPAKMEKLAVSSGWDIVSDSSVEEWKKEFPSAVPLSRKNVGMQWNERIWVGQRQSLN